MALGEALRRTLFDLSGSEAASDAQLLERFAQHQDQAAFAALVRRHGPMVLRLCRRQVRHEQDAEDAFQAAFLVLARRAGAIRRPEQLANWLYGVTWRVANKARAAAGRRHAQEGPNGGTLPPDGPPARTEVGQGSEDFRPILDEELARLPERYRAPLVLCYLESHSVDEAAAELGVARGTVASRMSRGRDLLRNRLTKRGIGVPASMLATVLTGEAASAAVPVALLDTTVKAATAAVGEEAAVLSPAVAALAQGLLRQMFIRKLVLVACCVLGLLTVGGTGTAVWIAKTGNTEAKAATESKTPREAVLWRKRWAIANDDLEGHFAVFSPDGRRLTVAPSNPMAAPVRVIDAATGRVLSSWNHRRRVHLSVVSPYGKYVFIEWADPPKGWTTRLLDAATGKELWTVPYNGQVCFFSFFADGKKVLLKDGQAHAMGIWDLATGKKQELVGAPWSEKLNWRVFSPDWRWGAATEGASPYRLKIFDLQTGREWAVWQLPADRTVSLGVSPDGKTLAANLFKKSVANSPAEVRLWDVAAARELGVFPATVSSGRFISQHYGIRDDFRVNSFVAPDWQYLVTASEGKFKAYAIATGKQVAAFGLSDGASDWAFFSPDGKWLITRQGDEWLSILWRVPSFEQWAVLPKGKIAYSFTPDSRALLVTGEKTLERWDLVEK